MGFSLDRINSYKQLILSYMILSWYVTLCLDVEVVSTAPVQFNIIFITDEAQSLVSSTQAQINLILLCNVDTKTYSEKNM